MADSSASELTVVGDLQENKLDVFERLSMTSKSTLDVGGRKVTGLLSTVQPTVTHELDTFLADAQQSNTLHSIIVYSRYLT